MKDPAIREPGGTFRARFLGFRATIDEIKLVRTVGPAVISRVVPFEEDKSAAYYYDREVVVSLPHDAYGYIVHGTGKTVSIFGDTPTCRIGKTNSESFRVVRFRNKRVESCTYNGHETSAIPFPRGARAPLSVSYAHPNDGTEPNNTATVANRLLEPYPNGRVNFVVPAGKYSISEARLESQILSDDGRLDVLTVRVGIPTSGSTTITLVQDDPHPASN